MNWQAVDTLANEVVSEEDLTVLREQLVDRMMPNAKWSEAEVSERLHASPNPHFKKLAKDYEEHKHRARTLPTLLPILEKLKTQWRYINYGFQFKFTAGHILCWWPRSGALDWQGASRPNMGPAVVGDVRQVLDAYVAFCDATVTAEQEGYPEAKPLPALPKPDRAVLACVVCGAHHEAQRCGSCGAEQSDLCVTCFPRAHYCLRAVEGDTHV